MKITITTDGEGVVTATTRDPISGRDFCTDTVDGEITHDMREGQELVLRFAPAKPEPSEDDQLDIASLEVEQPSNGEQTEPGGEESTAGEETVFGGEQTTAGTDFIEGDGQTGEDDLRAGEQTSTATEGDVAAERQEAPAEGGDATGAQTASVEAQHVGQQTPPSGDLKSPTDDDIRKIMKDLETQPSVERTATGKIHVATINEELEARGFAKINAERRDALADPPAETNLGGSAGGAAS